jgi:curved DNA-binding protein CbpA
MAEVFDPYRVLEIDPEASDDAVKAAYRRLARRYHPDLAAEADAAAKMAVVNRAWELLGEPAKRARYDRDRRLGRENPGYEPPAPTPPPAPKPRPPEPPPEQVSSDWTSGRSSVGGTYDDSMREPDGLGAAGPPPGRPSGSVLNFGRYAGWSLGEIARTDIDYIEWLDRTPIGRPFRDELDALLRKAGRRASATTEATQRRGLYRRR